MTNFETALRILSQQFPTRSQALAFREWLQAHDLLEMGAIGIRLTPHPDFDAIRQLFSETTFHALEGCYHWDANLLDYFRRRAGNIQWLELLTE